VHFRFWERGFWMFFFIFSGFLGCADTHHRAILNLKNPDPHVRMAACAQLGRSKDPQWVPYLEAQLRDPDTVVVQNAVSALQEIHAPRAIQSLIELLIHEDPSIRYITEKAIVDFGADAAAPLVEALKHAPVGIQAAAARILGTHGDPSAVSPLLAALDAPFPDRVRIAAVTALGELGDPRAVDPLMKMLYEKESPGHHEVPEALARLGPPAVEPLIQTLGNPDWDVVRMAAAALGMLGDPQAVPPLMEKLGHPDFLLGKAAADALVAIGAAAVPLLMEKALKEDAAGQAAFEILVGIGPPGVDPFLAQVETDPRRYRKVALKVLPSLGNAVVDPLMSRLKSESSPIRDFSIDLLGAVGPPAVSALVKGLKTGELPVKVRCAQALGLAKAKEGVAPLMEALDSETEMIQETAAEALARIGNPAAAPLIRVLMDPETPADHPAGKILTAMGPASVEPLIRVLAVPREGIPEAPSEILCRIGASAVSGLIAYLSDPDPEIGRACAEILKRIGAPSVKPLMGIVESADPDRLWRAVRILAEMETFEALDALSGVIRHGDPAVRYFAVQGLGAIMAPSALPVLKKALADRVAGRRAAEALAALGWRPKTLSEKVYAALSVGDAAFLFSEKHAAYRLLLSDLRRGDAIQRDFALGALEAYFGDTALTDLVRLLNTEGSSDMALGYLASASEPLRNAGKEWLLRHAPEAYPSGAESALLLQVP